MISKLDPVELERLSNPWAGQADLLAQCQQQASDLNKQTLANIRTLQSAQPSGDEVEAVARKLAPFMEGGREYDQMPATRRELKIWSRNGMALINDATQDDAQEAATAAITVLDAHRGKQACLKDRENSDG